MMGTERARGARGVRRGLRQRDSFRRSDSPVVGPARRDVASFPRCCAMSDFSEDLNGRATMADLRPVLGRLGIRARAKEDAIDAIRLSITNGTQPGRVIRYVLEELPATTVRRW